MSKAILLAVSHGFGGYGDFLFALKLAKELKNQYAKSGLEAPPIHIVTQPEGKQTVEELKGDTEFGVNVLTTDQLKEMVEKEKTEFGLVIEGPTFSTDLMKSIATSLNSQPEQSNKIALMLVTEYSFHAKGQRQKIKKHQQELETISSFQYCETIYSGFSPQYNEKGILIDSDNSQISVDDLDTKISQPLGLGIQNVDNYQQTSELSMQSSHDRFALDTEKTPAEHFLRIHTEFCDNSKNQDIVMIGASEEKKREALATIKNQLIDKEYGRIIFYNADSKVEELMHEEPASNTVYRVIYTKGMTHRSMMALAKFSGPLCGATGDQSLGEALSEGKLVVYECLLHKRDLINDYDNALVYEANRDLNVKETVSLLRNYKNNKAKYKRLGTLLHDKPLREKIVNTNQTLLAKNNLGTTVAQHLFKTQIVLSIIDLMQSDTEAAFILFQNHQQEIDLFALIEFYNDRPFDSLKGFLSHFSTEEILQKLRSYALSVKKNAYSADVLSAFDPFLEFNGKPLLEHLMEDGSYELVFQLIAKNYDKLGDFLYRKTSRGHSILAELKSFNHNHNNEYSSIITQAVKNSFNHLFSGYTPKPTSKRQVMHNHFMQLITSLNNADIDAEKAIIGLLILTRKNIGAEYKWFSPQKGRFFGSKLYSMCDKALLHLNINVDELSNEQKLEYFQALRSAINNNPMLLANNYLLDSLRKEAYIDLPREEPIMQNEEALQILITQRYPIDDSILKTNTGFYKLIPIKSSGVNHLFKARHYSLDKINNTLKIGMLMLVEANPLNEKSVLEYKKDLYLDCNEQEVEVVEDSENCYLITPIQPGISLQEYLSLNPSLSLINKRLLVNKLSELVSQTVLTNIYNFNAKNIVINLKNLKMYVIDFSLTRTAYSARRYQYIHDSDYKIEEMPPEYMDSNITLRYANTFMFAMLAAEIMGCDRRVLIKDRMERAFAIVGNKELEMLIIELFDTHVSLHDALLSSSMNQYHDHKDFKQFIKEFVRLPYDYSLYKNLLGKELLQMLNDAQSLNSSKRVQVTNYQNYPYLIDNLLPYLDPALNGNNGYQNIAEEPFAHGGWSRIYTANSIEKNNEGLSCSKEVVIKVENKSPEIGDKLDKECELLSQAYPDQYFNRIDGDTNAYLIMPLRRGQALDNYLNSNQDLDIETRYNMVLSLLNTVKKIHDNQVVHNDMKPNNIVYDSNTNEMQVVDFGSAEHIGYYGKYNDITTAKYPIEYMPPEYLDGMSITEQGDIYSLSLTLAEILGCDKKALTRRRIEKALTNIDDEKLTKAIWTTFELSKSLEHAVFTPPLSNEQTNPNFDKFITNFVNTPNDFSEESEKIGDNMVAFLETLQADEAKRPANIENCIELFEQFTKMNSMSLWH